MGNCMYDVCKIVVLSIGLVLIAAPTAVSSEKEPGYENTRKAMIAARAMEL